MWSGRCIFISPSLINLNAAARREWPVAAPHSDECDAVNLTRIVGLPVHRCVCVIVTRDRPALLAQCLNSIAAQSLIPDLILVVDNASGPETQRLLAAREGVRVLRLPENLGGAGGFRVGIDYALQCGAEWLWLMDDDGRPREPACLDQMLSTAAATEADMVGPLVVDVDRLDRLAFPIRINGRTRFGVAEVAAHGQVAGFVHLFNGALISAALFHRIGLPDARFFIRGDEVEFLIRARRSGARIVLETRAHFLHPGSHREIHPIAGGLFYAVVPLDAVKQYYQFRNRAFIFLHYRMWLWLAADMVRYGMYFLVSCRFDLQGFARWLAATRAGLSGQFMRGEERGAEVGRPGADTPAFRLPEVA